MKTIEQIIQKIAPINGDMDTLIQQRLDSLTKPPGSLGRLEELAKTICRIRGEVVSEIKNKKIFVFAGDHGVVDSGVSAFPQEVTGQMLQNFIGGGAAINVLSRFAGASIEVIDVGVKGETPEGVMDKKVARSTQNMSLGPAMSSEEAIASIKAGIEVVEQACEKEKLDLIGFGEMGIGNTTAATAILAALCEESIDEITGKGTGINDQARLNKVAVIEKALEKNKPYAEDGLDILTKVGGFEIGAIAGGILAAASNRIPILLDGLIATAGALIAWKLQPAVTDYLIASHQSEEPGHKKMLNLLQVNPYLDFNLRLGEGTGAALLMNFSDASIKILNEMATFDSAGVSNKDE